MAMNRKEQVLLAQIQGLIGAAKGANMNDRDPNHFESVDKPLAEALRLCYKLSAPYPPITLTN